MLTRDQVEQALPANLKSAATQQFTDMINNVTTDPLVAEQIRDNFVSYSSVLSSGGKFKTEDYLNAVAYVSYKLMGNGNLDAYAKTFPMRYQGLVAKGTSSKDIAAYVAAYNKGKLVNLIMEQSMIPVHVLNADMFQKALRVQVDLMETAQSEKVRCDAANSILTHLAEPKKVAAKLEVTVKQDAGRDELKVMWTELASKQLDLINHGYTARDMASQPLIPDQSIPDAEVYAVDAD